MEILEFFHHGFVQRALLAGCFIAALCSILGTFLVLRRLSLIGDGLAHVTFGGVAAGLLFQTYPFYVAIPIVMASALGILKLIDKARLYGDAAIGIVSSVAGYGGLPKALVYGASKAALINFAETLYLDLAPRGLGVALINPGFVRTPLTDRNAFPMPYLISAEEAAAEIAAGERMVLQSGRFAVWAPFGSSFPYELRLAPLEHAPSFASLADADGADFAACLRLVLERFRSCLGDPDYNLVLQQAPAGGAPGSVFHWRLDILPMLIRTAGFEWGTGIHINPTPPEEAALLLRDADGEK